jgi:hypothetical protein
MLKQVALAVMVAGVAVSPFSLRAEQFAPRRPRCLHGSLEQPKERSRREAALKMAHQINLAEGFGPLQLPSLPRQYRPLEQLRNVPSAPDGFTLQFYTDGPTYTFSLKDTLDPCHYAIFSDQDRGIYEGIPNTGVQVIPTTNP